MKKYDKLIRDKIPQIIKSAGKSYKVEVMKDEEYKLYLEKKLLEEINEYLESKEIEELADIFEVIYAIFDINDISMEKVEEIRKKKANERGVFKRKLKLLQVK